MLNKTRKIPGGWARDVGAGFKPALPPILQIPLPTSIRWLARRTFGPTFQPLLKSPKGWGWGVGGGARGEEAQNSSLGRPLTSSPKRPAVFLDRDGTINEEMGYINHLSRLCLLPDAAPAIRRLNDAQIPVVVITNQSGASRGYFPAALVDEVHGRLHELLAQGGARVDAIYTCLHGPEAGCSCRKPRPGLILQAARDLHLDVSRSYLVGDRYKDVETAANAGAQGILVLTGYGLGEYEHFHDTAPAKPVKVAANLLEAADFIINKEHIPEW